MPLRASNTIILNEGPVPLSPGRSRFGSRKRWVVRDPPANSLVLFARQPRQMSRPVNKEEIACVVKVFPDEFGRLELELDRIVALDLSGRVVHPNFVGTNGRGDAAFAIGSIICPLQPNRIAVVSA